jgi:hypothetical protein
MDEQELRQQGFGLYAPGTPVPPGHMKIQQGDDGPVWVGPRSAFQEKPLGAVEPLGSGVAQYGQMLGQGALTTGRFLAETGLKSALPTLGAIGGGAIPVPGIAGPIGAAGGAMAGMKANELLGIEPPQGMMDYALGGGLAMLPSALRYGVKQLPGAALGQQELGRETAAKLPGALLPSTPSKTLYAALPKSATIALPNTAVAAADLASEAANVAPSLRTGAMKKISDAAHELAAAGSVNPDTFQANVTQFGRIVRQAQQTGAIHEAAASKVYGALLDDLEHAGAQSGSQYAPMFRQAADAYKRELASQRLADIIGTGAKGVQRSRGGVMNTNWDAAVNKIMADKDMARWLPAAERESLVRDLQGIAKDVPQIPTSAGPGIGGQSFAQRAITGGLIGGGIGAAIGSPVIGGAIGVVGTEAIAQLLMTPLGRGLVRGMLRKGVPWEQIGSLAMQLPSQGIGATIRGMR